MTPAIRHGLAGTLALMSCLVGLSAGCRWRTGPRVVLILQVATDDIEGDTVDAGPARLLGDGAVEETIKVLKRRVRLLPLSDAVVTAYEGGADQVKVEMWGVSDLESAKKFLTRRGHLQLKVVEDFAGSRELLLKNHGGALPAPLQIFEGQGEEPGQAICYLVRRDVVITGRDIKGARAGVGLDNRPNVQFILSPTGAEKFGRETAANVGRRLAIILDDLVVSAPTIQGAIADSGVINGRFTSEEAAELAKVLRTGPLPARVTCLRVIGPAPP